VFLEEGRQEFISTPEESAPRRGARRVAGGKREARNPRFVFDRLRSLKGCGEFPARFQRAQC